jgi:hypothetical protein
LLVVAGVRAAHRLAVALQVLLIVAVMQMPLLLPMRERFLLDGYGSPAWLDTGSAWLPPLWFLSLYQHLAGSPYHGAMALTTAAAALGVALPLLALVSYAASYPRLTRLAVEGRATPRVRRKGRGRGLLQSVSLTLARVHCGAAVCAFTLRTFSRSRQHRLVLAVWIGVALALTISAALPMIVRRGWSSLAEPSAAALVGPLIFAALILVGMRSLFAIPAEIKASWLFRLHEPRDTAGALEGAEAALLIGGVGGPAVLAFTTGTLLWGVSIGIAHALFCSALALVLAQFIALGLDRVPFTVPYVPGTGRIGKLWPVYLTAFSFFTYTMAALEAYLLGNASAFVRTLGVILLITLMLVVVRRRAARRLPGLRFEPDDQGLVVVSLQADRTPRTS